MKAGSRSTAVLGGAVLVSMVLSMWVARPGPEPLLDVTLRLEWSDEDVPRGTLLEVVDGAGEVVAAFGIPEGFATNEPVGGSRVEGHVGLSSGSVQVREMGHPVPGAGAIRLVAHFDSLLARDVVDPTRQARLAEDGTWEEVDTADLALGWGLAGEGLQHTGEDVQRCGPFAWGKGQWTVFRNCAFVGDDLVYATPGANLAYDTGPAGPAADGVSLSQIPDAHLLFVAQDLGVFAVLGEGPVGDLALCGLEADDGVRFRGPCSVVERPEGTFPYAIYRDERAVWVTTNDGAVLRVDTDGMDVRTTSSAGSFQVYAALRTGDAMLLGTYPENLVVEAGDVGDPSRGARLGGESPLARWTYLYGEVQSLALFGGTVYAGSWPYGEVFRLDAGEWTRTVRLFDAPELPDAVGVGDNEPFSSDFGTNGLGQRIPSLVQFGGRLYAATSAKDGITLSDILAEPVDPVTPALADQYGRVVALETTQAVVDFQAVSATDRLGSVRITIGGGHVEVRGPDGGLLAVAKMPEGGVGCAGDIRVGDGLYGSSVGFSVTADFHTNRWACD